MVPNHQMRFVVAFVSHFAPPRLVLVVSINNNVCTNNVLTPCRMFSHLPNNLPMLEARQALLLHTLVAQQKIPTSLWHQDNPLQASQILYNKCHHSVIITKTKEKKL